MGKIIQKSGGKTTVYVTGVNIGGLAPASNTYYIGVDLTSGRYEKLNPTGTIINFEDNFTGGTVNGDTEFTGDLIANVFSAATYLNLPVSEFTGGTVNGDTEFTGDLIANVFSAATYLNLPENEAIEVTYDDLVALINTGGLTSGNYYLITDFRTCYDQPDYNLFGNDITTGNYKQGPVEPLVVLATSFDTISNDAYQPTYPNDKIKYDWTFSTTEVTNGDAYGRITERVDEFNNRTDYDHRNVLFRRYDNYYYTENNINKGTIELIQNTGEVIGTETEFLNYNTGDYIAISNTNEIFFEIVSISGDTSMVVSGLTIPAVSAGSSFYSAQRDGLTYKQNNISVQYTEHPTFLLENETIISNYIGDVASFINWQENTFLLPNNVFGEDVIGNRIGNNFRNNTFNSDVEHNVIGDLFENNTIYNDADFTDNQIAANFRYNLIICDDFNDNVIGDNCNNNKIFNNITFVDNQIGVGFNNNIIYDNFEDNKIGNGFYYNIINGSFNHNSIGNQFNNNEIFSQFYDNLIANEFINNTVYCDFYKNQILDYFNDNVIGDFANYGNFDFYRNYIRNNFNENVIRQDFQNNQIGTNFQENEINGEFQGNTILNGFNNNTTGSGFNLNNIGNGFNNNTIYDDFYRNTSDYYFYDNVISNRFNTNKVGTYFENNRPSNYNLFGWNDLSTVSSRTYNTLRISLDNNVGNYILGKELVMRVISTQQYFRIKFTQWTQGANGGGFRYERQEIDSNGNNIGSFVVFTKTNYGSEVDIIVPGVVELTRDSQGGLYNTITDTPPFFYQWPGPGDTEWNSIYTQQNNGERFGYNKIGNNFIDNTIGSDFGYGDGNPYGNIINDNFENNTIGQFAYNNVIGNEFKGNTIGDNFEDNTIKNYFLGNTIGDGFESNEIGNYFGNDGSALGTPLQNIIFNNFKYNKIGNFFGNDANFPTVTGGTNGDGGNIINDNFQFNVIDDNFIFNAIDEGFRYNQVGTNFWFNVFGIGAEGNVLGSYFVGNGGGDFPTPMGDYFASNKFGNYVAFNSIGYYFQSNNIGNFFGTAPVDLGISNTILDNFQNNVIGNNFGYDPLTPGDGGNLIEVDFQHNKIGNGFNYNTTFGAFYDNVINNDFTLNLINYNFNFNKIGNLFSNNIIDSDFAGNTVDYFFYSSDVSTYCQSNKFGSGNFFNTLGSNFIGNTIGSSFIGNDILDSFEGNKVGSAMGGFIFGNTIGFNCFSNNIGNNFRSNEIGDGFSFNQIGNAFDGNSSLFNNFTYNSIGDNFTSNVIYNNFTYNRIETELDSIDFGAYLSGVTSISFSYVGVGTPGTYTNLASTGGTGTDATFDVVVDASSAVTSVVIYDMGINYMTGNTLTIDGALYGGVTGVDSISINILEINTPSVYQTYNCQLFEIGGGNKKLSYYDDSSVLVITDVNL